MKKPKGICPICLRGHVLSNDGTLILHRENPAEWRFRKWCQSGLLKSKDRRAELLDLDLHHPRPLDCPGSYLPPLESSSVGLLWAIEEHRKAEATMLDEIAKIEAGTLTQIVINEVAPHFELLGNYVYVTVVKKGSPEFAGLVAERLALLRASVQKIPVRILRAQRFVNWVTDCRKQGSPIPSEYCGMALERIEHGCRFSVLTKQEARMLIARLVDSEDI